MKRSEKAAKLRRREIAALNIANRVASENYPWTTANLRTWQNVMCNASKERGKILLAYLAERRARNT